MNINWQSFDDKMFQRFCNALLSLEVSKRFEPFSAPGRDGGIDGLFSGTYDGKTGDWRFQLKFHKTARREGYSALKSELIPEINKLKTEDHFILVSNVGLLPKEKKELQTLAERELQRLNKKVTFEVWDDAKIHTFYIRHPILRLWIEEGFQSAQLIPYQDYFGSRLETGIEDPSTLGNEFISRDVDLRMLSDFIGSTTEQIAVVSGEAGIGKTRLVIEFFKNRLGEDWRALVLNTHRIAFDKISFGLSGAENFVLMVDDAHNASSETIADLRNLLRLPGHRKLKLILTGRKVSIDRALELLPVVEEKLVKAIPLEKLSPDETRELFIRQQNIGYYRDYIPQLVATSNGRPILIVALLRAIHQRTPIPKIKDEDMLKNYVREYFTAVIKVESDDSGISKLNLDNLMRLMCLLEPLPFRDDVFYSKMSAFSHTPVHVVMHFMDKLLNEGLAIRRFEFVVSPDYYSDIILATADQQFILLSIVEFPESVPNIIVNLSAVDEAYDDKDKNRLGLDSVLRVYVDQIEANTTYAGDIQRIFYTIASVAYNRPEAARRAVELLGNRLAQPDSHQLKGLLIADAKNHSSGYRSLYGSIARVLRDLLLRKDNEKFVFDAIVTLYNHVSDLGVFKNTFALDSRHVTRGYNFQQQQAFVTLVLTRSEPDEKLALFFVDAFKNFLQLEFTVTSMDVFKAGQINITTFYLPADPQVVSFRREVIAALKSLYNTVNHEEVRRRIIHELMDVPRAISASTRSKKPYEGVEEVVSILEFVESVTDSMPLSANREVVDRLYWMRKWESEEKVVERMVSLRKALQPKTLTEKILFLLNNAEARLDRDYKKVIESIKEQAHVLIHGHEAEVIAQSLVQVRKVTGNQHSFVWVFNLVLHDEFAEKAMKVYDELWRLDKEYIYYYGSSFLYALRFNHRQLDFFWTRVTELESNGSAESLNVILFVYNRLTDPTNQQDVDLIARIYRTRKDDWPISFNLLMALVTIGRSGSDTSLMIESLFDTCPQKAADHFLTFNEEMDSKALKRLVLFHTTHFYLSFEIQHALSILIGKKELSEEELFEYFERRFSIKNGEVERKEYSAYQFVPPDNFNLLAKLADDGRLRFFARSLKWYVNADFKGMGDYYAKDLLEFLQPSKELTNDLLSHYEGEIANVSSGRVLHRLLTSLDVFESKTRSLIDLIILILKKGEKMADTEWDRLQSDAYSAISSVGVKSGAVGEPFPVDVELRQLLVDWLADNPSDSLATQFLTKAIKALDQDIERSMDRDENVW